MGIFCTGKISLTPVILGALHTFLQVIFSITVSLDHIFIICTLRVSAVTFSSLDSDRFLLAPGLPEVPGPTLLSVHLTKPAAPLILPSSFIHSTDSPTNDQLVPYATTMLFRRNNLHF